MSIPVHYSCGPNGTVFTLYIKGRVFTVTPEHPSYGVVKRSLSSATEDELLVLLDAKNAVENYVSTDTSGLATVVNGVVFYKGQELHNAMSNRILDLMRDGLPFVNLLRCLERIENNPSYKSRQELFSFLDHKGMPITEDGCFLAYKVVRSDYLDKYSGTIDNHPGQVISMDRTRVDDDNNNHCSSGLHVGTLSYVYSYSYGNSSDKIVIVKVDPADCVSVPTDHDFQKLRTCKYTVLSDFEGELQGSLYTAGGERVELEDDDNWDFDWDSDCDCDCDDDHDYNDDDQFKLGDVTSSPSSTVVSTPTPTPAPVYGVKPSGQRYWNFRVGGKFAPKR